MLPIVNSILEEFAYLEYVILKLHIDYKRNDTEDIIKCITVKQIEIWKLLEYWIN